MSYRKARILPCGIIFAVKTILLCRGIGAWACACPQPVTVSSSFALCKTLSCLISLALCLLYNHSVFYQQVNILCPAQCSSIFSINIPYPRVGSFTSTWITAPKIFPFCRMGLPLTSDCH